MKKKTEEEIDHENGQLDNLFLTLRESIVETLDEPHPHPSSDSKNKTSTAEQKSLA